MKGITVLITQRLAGNKMWSPRFASKLACAIIVAATLAPPGLGAAAESLSNPDLIAANRLAAQRKYKDAIESYKRAVEKQPKSALCHHYYGRTLALTGRFVEALNEYKKALEINGQDGEVYNDIGVALSINDFAPEGAKFIKRAVDLKPRLIGASNNLGAVLTKLGAYEQAVEYFTKSLQLQPRNPVIQNRCADAKLQLEKSQHFDFGAPVGPADIPDITAKLEQPDEPPAVAVMPDQPKDESPKTKQAARADINSLMKEAEGWLESGQGLFLELRAEGFAAAKVSGSGMVQFGDKCIAADELKEIDLKDVKTVEVSGDISLDFQGKGIVRLGSSKIESQEEDGRFSVDCSQEMVTCRSGTFEMNNWPSVNALRDGKRVRISADRCGKVYAQDDAKVKTSNCNEVSLVSWSTGTVMDCDALLLNDNARGFAVRCNEVTVLGAAKAKIFQCGVVEKQDQGSVEYANSANL